MPDGVHLPVQLLGPEHASSLMLVVGHGLGGTDPARKSHHDDAVRMILPALDAAACRAVFYTARGHGQSAGWQTLDDSQFSWSHLADDMLAVADAHGLPRFVACGNSMGAATALTAALKEPERVQGLLLYRLPMLWEARTTRRAELLAKAAALPSVVHRAVLRGSAGTNLPPQNDPAWDRLRAAQIPTLILCHGEDAVHPIASGEAIRDVLPNSSLHVESDEARAAERFPDVVAAWLRGLRRDVE